MIILNAETLSRLSTIIALLTNTSVDISYDLDFANNALDLHLESYVFDSLIIDLTQLFSTADIIVIDALDDGKICIEMRILNACQTIK